MAAAAMAGAAILGGAPAHARTSVGIGIDVPLTGPGYYAPADPYPYDPYPPYYAPPPAEYYGPPPQAAYAQPAPAYDPPPQEDCRETRVPATIGGRQEWLYGTACRQPDGSWQNVD